MKYLSDCKWHQGCCPGCHSATLNNDVKRPVRPTSNREKDAEEIAMRKLIWNLSAVARSVKAERGMSLVEATIVLMTLAVLTAVAAPSINDYIQDARDVKAKEDVEAIGTAIHRVLRDTGLPMLVVSASTTPELGVANRVDLLVSSGTTPTLAAAVTSYNSPSNGQNPVNWDMAPGNLSGVGVDTMLNQFVANGPSYTRPSQTNMSLAGPAFGIGWRGAYLSAAIGPDPWGNRYSANTMFLAPASNAADLTAEGGYGWTKDVVVLSAGRNGIIEIPFGGNANGGTTQTGDDVFYVVSGNSR